MNDTIKLVLAGFVILALALSLFLSLSYVSASWHEEAHRSIFKYAGSDANVQLVFHPSSLGFSGKTIPDLNEFNQDYWTVYLAHSINESIGYQLNPFLILLSTLAILQTSFLLIIAWRV